MRLFILLLCLICTSGCSEFARGFVNSGTPQYLDITVEDQQLGHPLCAYYVDSVMNKGVIYSEEIKSKFFVFEGHPDWHYGDRLIHFTEGPEEWYWLQIWGGGQFLVMAVYNPGIAPYQAVRDRDVLGAEGVKRVTDRIQKIVNSIRIYGARHPGLELPDPE